MWKSTNALLGDARKITYVRKFEIEGIGRLFTGWSYKVACYMLSDTAVDDSLY